MNLQNYKNKVSQDLQYWSDVNKAKLPEKNLCELVPPLTEEEKQLLPVGIRNFYYYGRWFFNFIGNVVVPYNRLLLLYSQRHISALFKSFMVYDEHEIELPMSSDAFDLLSSIPMGSAKELCRLIAGGTNNAETLLNCLIIGDRQGFHHCYSGLELPKITLEAITKTINFMKSIAFSNAVEEIGDVEDIAAAKFAIKSHVSEVSAEREYDREITEFTLSIVDTFLSLVDNKFDKELHEVIDENFPYEIWVIIAKRFFSMSVYQMRRIWDDLTQDEKDIVDEVINPEKELVLIANGERLRLGQSVIQLALRWSKVSRKNVLDRSKSMAPRSEKKENGSVKDRNVDYSGFYAPVPPKIDYKWMRDIAARLAGKVKVGNSITSSQVAYISPQDRARFCYFFLHKIESPDDITTLDFSYPIQWHSSWQSFKYFVYRLYGRPKTATSNLKKMVVEAFRFSMQRPGRCVEPGKISEKTYNTSKNILTIVADEDKKRIDNLLLEFERFLED